MKYTKIENIPIQKEVKIDNVNTHKEESRFYFEILAVDVKDEVVFKNEQGFCHALLSNSNLWDNAEIKGNNVVEDKKVRVQIKKTENKKDKEVVDYSQSYIITIDASYLDLESFRLRMLDFLKKQKFEYLYVLEDQVSLLISKKIYPSIYKVESFLRKYIIKFFVVKLGPEWWSLTAASEMKDKINKRKNNETEFSKYIDNEVYLIDFGELGKLIYEQSSGNLSKDDIVSKILKLEETVESIKKFKEEVQSNYNKFFKKIFKENKFQENWEKLEKIRHKIAHNNLFILDDLETSSALVSNLIQTIETANIEIDKVSFNDNEKQLIINSFIEIKPINRNIFIDELTRSINWANSRADGFVGLKNFVDNILGSKGYDYQSIQETITELENDGIVEKYPYYINGMERPVSSIRFVEDIHHEK